MTDSNVSVPIVTEPTAKILTEKQLVDFRAEQEALRDWLEHFGKDPQKAIGYGDYTVQDTMYRADKFYRWVWDYEGRYTLQLTIDHADEYMKYQARREAASDTKASVQRAVKRLYKWLHHEGTLPEWDPEITYSNSSFLV